MNNKANLNGLVVIISSPSGGGKTTVVSELLKRHPDWVRSVSATTRAPRPGEKDGQDYFFLDEERFKTLFRDNGFLESAKVHMHRYGTPREFVEAQVLAKRVVFLTVDVQGAEQVKRLWHNPANLLSIFIMPISVDILRERLLRRNTETPEQVEVRLAAAKKEMEQAGFYDFTVYNHDLDQTVGEIEQLIDKRRQV